MQSSSCCRLSVVAIIWQYSLESEMSMEVENFTSRQQLWGQLPY